MLVVGGRLWVLLVFLGEFLSEGKGLNANDVAGDQRKRIMTLRRLLRIAFLADCGFGEMQCDAGLRVGRYGSCGKAVLSVLVYGGTYHVLKDNFHCKQHPRFVYMGAKMQCSSGYITPVLHVQKDAWLTSRYMSLIVLIRRPRTKIQ